MGPDLPAQVTAWIEADPDPVSRAELQGLTDAGTPEAAAGLTERFSAPLVFGTAGLRGPLRAGPNGMNTAVVRRAAAGLAAYLTAAGRDGAVVIGYDARHGSTGFARDTAAVIRATDRIALLLPRPLPTPVLAFAVRQLGAAAGVMVTASHNPPADNGYKVYLGDGAQIVPPADREIEAAIAAVGPAAGVPYNTDYELLGDEIEAAYVARVAALVSTATPRGLTIAYTPLHGVGLSVVEAVFATSGFPALQVVSEQAEPDPDFPTVAFPNPEEPGATDLLLALAAQVGANVAIANDPDADRCAVAVSGRLLTGDELGILLADHLLSRRPVPAGTFATTIVSSSLLGKMCDRQGVPYAETLTGFKWIVRAAEQIAYGYEEALGYAVAPELVLDKDGISAALLVAEMTSMLKASGLTLLDRLDQLATGYGLHATDQLSIRVDDRAVISAAMARLRRQPPTVLIGRPVQSTEDLLPESDVVLLRADRVRVVVRPSGTEPKLKAYLEIVVPVGDEPVAAARVRAAEHLAALRAELADALGI